MTKNIGVQVTPPKNECTDKLCPFHGSLSVRGRTFEGVVTSSKATKTAYVSWQRQIYISKYQRYTKKSSKVAAHNPPCINAQEGDKVKIMETRPLSKTKHFVIIEKQEESIK
ncbi:30S ribosomal protein S17 [Candidatus Woesearchaeota archaeon]|nr:30S ribosomal protein S17 [Candidatus Woesearchaeota archaeon]